MNRILVVRGGAIGDFVLTLPALKAIREGFPESKIEILGYKHIVALAENRFYATAARSIEYAPLASFFAKGTHLPAELADYFHSFDLVVSYLFDPDHIFEQNVARCGVDNFLACSPKVTGPKHAAIQLARPLDELGLHPGSPAAELYPTAGDAAGADAFLQSLSPPVIAFHPGSGSPTKNWPVARWQRLAAMLLETKRANSLLVVGGEADDEALSAFKRADTPLVHFGECLPLPLLAAILQRCSLFVGHDSGISHIAAAVNTPAVLLFGPTDPTVWAPANQRTQVVRPSSHQLDELSLEDVIAAIAAANGSSLTS